MQSWDPTGFHIIASAFETAQTTTLCIFVRTLFKLVLVVRTQFAVAVQRTHEMSGAIIVFSTPVRGLVCWEAVMNCQSQPTHHCSYCCPGPPVLAAVADSYSSQPSVFECIWVLRSTSKHPNVFEADVCSMAEMKTLDLSFQGKKTRVNRTYGCWDMGIFVFSMYGCPGQHRSRVLQLAEPFCIIHPERGANPSCLCWPGRKESVTWMWSAGSIYWHLHELLRSEAQSAVIQVFKYTGVWSCAEGTASEESGKESCVIKLAIEGSIENGSITQHIFCHWMGLIPPKYFKGIKRIQCHLHTQCNALLSLNAFGCFEVLRRLQAHSKSGTHMHTQTHTPCIALELWMS